MVRSRIARRFAAAAIAVHAGLALTMWGSTGAGADDPSNCDGVTGELIDHGTTVTGVFDVPTTCDKVSVLSFFAPGPNGEYPQVFLDRIGHENVAPGHYEWTIAAPPPECFRQLDLRVPNRNVDSIVGGERLCEESTPPTTNAPPTTSTPPTTNAPPTTSTPPTTSRPTSTTTSTTSTIPPEVSPTTTSPPPTSSTTIPPEVTPTTTSPSTTVPPEVSPTTTPPTTTPPTTAAPSTTVPPEVSPTTASPSTTTTVEVLGVVLSPPAGRAELPRTGRSLAEVVGIALLGVGLGFGVLTAQEWQRQTRAG